MEEKARWNGIEYVGLREQRRFLFLFLRIPVIEYIGRSFGVQ